MSRELHFGISDQSKAAIHRFGDAEALFRECRWHGAMYLAGYSVECLLKKKLMEKFGCRNLQELEDELQDKGQLALDATIFTHHLESLLRIAGGVERIRQNQPMWKQFKIVNEWVPAWRYSPYLGRHEDAEDFIGAVSDIRRWITANV